MPTPQPTPVPEYPAREVWPGEPYPLGPDWDGEGTNFSIFSENAKAIELCLFTPEGEEERIEITRITNHNWHCYLPGVHPGQRYGFRVHGPYEPDEGHRFNPCKLLIDPYAKAIEGEVDWSQAQVLPYTPDGSDDADYEPDDEDSAPAIPKCLVVDHRFDWEDDAPPRHSWSDTASTRPTSRASRCSTPRCGRTCAGPTGAWLPSPRSTTSVTWG